MKTKIEKTNDQVFDQALSKLNLELYHIIIGTTPEMKGTNEKLGYPGGIDPKTGYISTFYVNLGYDLSNPVEVFITRINVYTNDPEKIQLSLVEIDDIPVCYRPLHNFPYFDVFMNTRGIKLDPEFIKLIEESKKL